MKIAMISLSVIMLVIGSSWATEGYNDLEKLVKSKTSDDVIIAFINTSKVSYALSADEIIHLKDMGASSAVITAAIQHRETIVAQNSQQTAEQPVVLAPVEADNSVVYEYVAPPVPYYYSDYPTYYGWGWGGGGHYYHRGGSGHYHGGYSTGHVSRGGSPRAWSGNASRSVSRSSSNAKRAR